jgi:hypothetical protein
LFVTAEGEYTVVAFAGGGCASEASSATTVTVFPLPAAPEVSVSGNILTASGTGTFQWYLDGVPIPGATDPEHVAVVNGTYQVLLTDANGCEAWSEPVLVNSTAVPGTEWPAIAVFPDPSDGIFAVAIGTGWPGVRIQVLDAAGRLVHQGLAAGPRTPVRLPGAASGSYTVLLQGAGWEYRTRMVVVR